MEGLGQLGLQAVYGAPGANADGSALHDSFPFSNDENARGCEKSVSEGPDAGRGHDRDPGETPTQNKTHVRCSFTPPFMFSMSSGPDLFLGGFFSVMRPKFVKLRHQHL